MNTLKTGLAELIFLLKGPESLSQLFSITGLQSGVSTKAETETILLGQAGGKEGEAIAERGGGARQSCATRAACIFAYSALIRVHAASQRR